MYKTIFAALLLVYFATSFAQLECPIHLPCNDTMIKDRNDSYVEQFCKDEMGNMSERCCFFNETIIGLDMRFCEIKTLNISQLDFSSLIILDLRENEFDKFVAEDLAGLVALKDLYLPQHISCPGGDDAWNFTSCAHNMTHCYYQEDPCIYLQISCTENGLCLHTGPGLAKCVCKPGHHGYKCLNEGEFPLAVFASSVIIPAVLLSIAVWFVQGRDVYKVNTL